MDKVLNIGIKLKNVQTFIEDAEDIEVMRKYFEYLMKTLKLIHKYDSEVLYVELEDFSYLDKFKELEGLENQLKRLFDKGEK